MYFHWLIVMEKGFKWRIKSKRGNYRLIWQEDRGSLITSLNLMMFGCLKDLWLIISLWTFSSIWNHMSCINRQAICKCVSSNIPFHRHIKLDYKHIWRDSIISHPSLTKPTSPWFKQYGYCIWPHISPLLDF